MPLTLVRGPVGFGKTTLVAQWLHGRPNELAAWVRVDEDAASASGFWQTLADAMADAGVEFPATADPRPPRALVRRAVAATAVPVVLVVDAFDGVRDDTVERDLLDLVRASPNLRLIVCLRGHRRFLRHAYLDLDFTVISASDLLFTVEETAALIEAFGISNLTKQRVRAVHAEGGGWPEPTRALAVALCNATAAAPNQPSDQDMATEVGIAFLRHRILPGVHPALADFALATSLVDGISPEIADQLVADGPAKTRLEYLRDDGLLYASAENGETVYKWPPAARRAMAAELNRRSPGRARQLHTKFSQIYAASGQPDRAIRHAMAAEDWPAAVRVIEQHWRRLLVAHRDLLYAALSAAPLEVVATSPRAVAVRELQLQAPDDRVLELIPDLPPDEGALAALGTAGQAAEIIDTGILVLIVLCRRGLFARAAGYAERLQAVAAAARVHRSAEIRAQLPGLWVRVGLVHLLADNLPDAYLPLKAAFENAEDSPFGYEAKDAAGKLALTAVLGGDVTEAEVWLRRFHEAPIGPQWLARTTASAGIAAEILLALERLDTPRAATLAASTVADLGIDEGWAFTTYARAQLALQVGDPLGGLRLLDHARAANPAWHGPSSTARSLLTAAEVDLLLSLGRGNHARSALQAAGSGHPQLRVPRARLALLSGQPGETVALAEDADWLRTASRRDQLDMLLLQAVGYHRLGRPDAATQSLSRALRIAEATRSLRPFTRIPRADLAAIASQLPGSRLLDASDQRTQGGVFPDHVELISLTPQEQVLLEHLAHNLPLQDIAGRLYLSINTVKSHRRTLYQKLHAADRATALMHARRLGLLPPEAPASDGLG